MTPAPFICPLCNTALKQVDGDSRHPNDPKFGVTLWCPSWECPAQEVAGHGDSAKLAYEVIQQKYKKDRTC